MVFVKKMIICPTWAVPALFKNVPIMNLCANFKDLELLGLLYLKLTSCLFTL